MLLPLPGLPVGPEIQQGRRYSMKGVKCLSFSGAGEKIKIICHNLLKTT
jgi:hypothetical protein